MAVLIIVVIAAIYELFTGRNPYLQHVAVLLSVRVTSELVLFAFVESGTRRPVKATEVAIFGYTLVSLTLLVSCHLSFVHDRRMWLKVFFWLALAFQ